MPDKGRILGHRDESEKKTNCQTDSGELNDKADVKEKKEVVNLPHNLRLCIEAELMSRAVRHDDTNNIIEVNRVGNQFKDIVCDIAKICGGITRDDIEQILKEEYLIPSNPKSKFDYYQLQSIPRGTDISYIRSSHSSVEVPQKKRGGSNRTIREEL